MLKPLYLYMSRATVGGGGVNERRFAKRQKKTNLI